MVTLVAPEYLKTLHLAHLHNLPGTGTQGNLVSTYCVPGMAQTTVHELSFYFHENLKKEYR